MQNNAPVPQGQPPQQQQAPEDPKLAKQRKREEAERQKKLQQEKRRQQELSLLVSNFSKAITTSVMDVPSLYKYACNSIKTMLQVDHVAIALFEEHQEIRPGTLCVFKGESNLPKLPKTAEEKLAEKIKEQQKKKEQEAQVKRVMIGDEIVETIVKPKKEETKKAPEPEPEPVRTAPTFPVPPKTPLRPGTLPRLDNIIADIPLLFKIKEIRQPAMVHDTTKFPDAELNKFASIYMIKSVLFIPFIRTPLPGEDKSTEEVVGVIAAMTVNENKALSQLDISFTQKMATALSKFIANAPPDLPVAVNKAIKSISKDDNSDKLIEFYSNMLDDIFDMIIYEVGWDNCSESFKKTYEDLDKLEEESRLKKIWFQINELIRSTGDVGSIARRALQEFFVQADEFTTAKNGVTPSGLRGIFVYAKKNLKYPELEGIKIQEEAIETLETQIDNALRGNALFTEKTKATLINDIEQSNMIMNYVAAPASIDFRNHIKAALDEYSDFPDEVDKESLLTDMCYQGMSEISRSVCHDLVEKVLLEIPEYLEQSPDQQADQTEALVTHFHRKVMSNLITTLKGKKNVWVNYIDEDIKAKAKEAAKKRAVMVGRIQSEVEEEE